MVAIENKVQRYDTYKDSGVEWLGEVPEHWKMKRFKFLANANKGKLPKNIVSINDDSLPPYMSMEYLRGGEENQWVKDKDALIINENEILLLWDGSNSGEFLKSRKGVISSTVAHILFNNIDQKFSWYHSKVLEVELRKNTIGMGIPHVNGRVLNNLTMLLPPLKEQTKIAQFLDDKTTKIDDAIAIKEQQINLLKERKQILIHKAVTRGLVDRVKLKDTGVEWIGEIPVHWEFIKVKNIFRLVIEPAAKNNDYELLSVYTDIGVKPRKELEERGNKASTTDGYWLVKKNDIVVNKLLAWMGAIGISDYNGVTSPAYDILRPTRPIAGYFYHNLFRTPNCKSELKKHSRGIMDMRLRLYFDKFGNVKVPYPPFNEQKEIVEYIETASQKIETAIGLKEQEIEKLKEYKGSLINGVVTGKVRVC
ncbi:restriction endonuclease subunit S [Dokdonia sp. LLG6352-1]|uniref:restriction endonuclease subunit S n=1 Tax=Dokdonia sp. LLG6352-1 TaxID=3160831 RepID=UPI00386D3E61